VKRDYESEDNCDEVWQRALEGLLAKGATQAEAVEGANLVVQAHLRERRERAGRAGREARTQSATLRRPEQYRRQAGTG
jgi:hypothetical protein